ncbi:hypothetical protein TYRP_014945 [Tyrophagus putrescentiae]|nr:hypothetical protein TYRP_014945 [Tyrophagus putrescentiae]
MSLYSVLIILCCLLQLSLCGLERPEVHVSPVCRIKRSGALWATASLVSRQVSRLVNCAIRAEVKPGYSCWANIGLRNSVCRENGNRCNAIYSPYDFAHSTFFTCYCCYTANSL